MKSFLIFGVFAGMSYRFVDVAIVVFSSSQKSSIILLLLPLLFLELALLSEAPDDSTGTSVPAPGGIA
eukprot:3886157-Amphidinium_carterae.1